MDEKKKKKKKKNSFDDRWSEVLRALDARAGIEHESDDAVIQEFERTQPVTLSSDLVDRVMARASTRPRSLDATPRSWWKRRVALVPMVLVLLAAGVPIAISWSGRRSSKELSYEEALHLVFDRGRTLENRLTALGRVHISVKTAIGVIRSATEGSSTLRRPAADALQELAAAIRDPIPSSSDDLPRGHLVACMTRLEDPAATVETIQDVLASALAGVAVLHGCNAEGRRFDEAAGIYLGKLQAYAQGR